MAKVRPQLVKDSMKKLVPYAGAGYFRVGVVVGGDLSGWVVAVALHFFFADLGALSAEGYRIGGVRDG